MAEEQPRKHVLRFHYLKSSGFRSIHVDGAIASPLPAKQGVHLAMYSERGAIPQQVDHEVDENGRLGPEVSGSRVSREGIVRELEVDLFMDVDTVAGLHALLGTVLKEMKGEAG